VAEAGIFPDNDGASLDASRRLGIGIGEELLQLGGEAPELFARARASRSLEKPFGASPALSLAPEAAELVYVHSCDAGEFRLEV
jgi:hypothetical protein